MKFLYPEFLFGLFTLAIPIIIHLFNFRRSKKIYFSSTRFLKNIKKSTSQKLKLKHYLILCSRLLFLAFLTFAFAQPYLPSADKNPQVESVYIYLDNSSSMTNKADGSLTSLDLGIEYIQRILDLYPTNTSYKFLTNEFAPFSNTLKSKDEVAELLTELKPAHISRTLPEAYARLSSQSLQETNKSKDVYVISDFQQSTIGVLSSVVIDSADQIFVAPIQFNATKNIFIDSIYLSNPFLVANEKNELNVLIRNSGFEDASELPIKLFINDIQTASSTVDVAAGTVEALTFEISYNLSATNLCRINFEDYPVTFDNDFFFVLKLENKINILEIKNESVVTPIEQVFGNASLFNFRTQQSSNLDYSLIRQFDLVIVNGLSDIDNSLTLELNNYINQGGTLFLVPGANPNLTAFRSFVPSLRPILNDSIKVDIAVPDLSNPFYENIFESSTDRIDMPEALPVVNWGGQQVSLLRTRNDLNYLSGFRSEGMVFMLATPLEDAFTSFHRHALFVPVMYRMAAMSKRTFEKQYYSINEPTINLKLDSLDQRDIFKLANQETELIPNQRISANELILEMPKNTLGPGFYTLKLLERSKAELAFNLDKTESYLEQLSLGDVSDFFSVFDNVNVFDADNADNFSNEIKKNKFGVPLWKYAIILALIFLLAEVLLIRFL